MTMKRIDNQAPPRIALLDKDGDDYVVAVTGGDIISITRNGANEILIYANDAKTLAAAIREVGAQWARG
jgi:hypothetical protein